MLDWLSHPVDAWVLCMLAAYLIYFINKLEKRCDRLEAMVGELAVWRLDQEKKMRSLRIDFQDLAER